VSKRRPADKKHLRQSERRNRRNRAVKSQVRSALKEFETTTDPAAKAERVKQTISTVDKAVSRGILHRNKAARMKSKLAKQANAAQSK